MGNFIIPKVAEEQLLILQKYLVAKITQDETILSRKEMNHWDDNMNISPIKSDACRSVVTS